MAWRVSPTAVARTHYTYYCTRGQNNGQCTESKHLSSHRNCFFGGRMSSSSDDAAEWIWETRCNLQAVKWCQELRWSHCVIKEILLFWKQHLAVCEFALTRYTQGLCTPNYLFYLTHHMRQVKFSLEGAKLSTNGVLAVQRDLRR